MDEEKKVYEFVSAAINKEIAAMVDDEMLRVAQRIEARKAEIVAGVVLHFKKHMEMNTLGQHLTITIDLKA